MSIKLRLDAGNDKYIILRNFSGCIVSGLELQNTAARLTVCMKKTDHITPVLKKLHWLAVTVDYVQIS